MITDYELDAEIKATQRKLIKLSRLRALRIEIDLLDHRIPYCSEAAKLMKIACDVRGISPGVLISRDRRTIIAETRFMIMLLLRKYTRASSQQVGKIFRLDHGAILHGERRALELIDCDPLFRGIFQQIEKQFLNEIGITNEHHQSATH